jgi:hypothetical protein
LNDRISNAVASAAIGEERKATNYSPINPLFTKQRGVHHGQRLVSGNAANSDKNKAGEAARARVFRFSLMRL